MNITTTREKIVDQNLKIRISMIVVRNKTEKLDLRGVYIISICTDQTMKTRD